MLGGPRSKPDVPGRQHLNPTMLKGGAVQAGCDPRVILTPEMPLAHGFSDQRFAQQVTGHLTNKKNKVKCNAYNKFVFVANVMYTINFVFI